MKYINLSVLHTCLFKSIVLMKIMRNIRQTRIIFQKHISSAEYDQHVASDYTQIQGHLLYKQLPDNSTRAL